MKSTICLRLLLYFGRCFWCSLNMYCAALIRWETLSACSSDLVLVGDKAMEGIAQAVQEGVGVADRDLHQSDFWYGCESHAWFAAEGCAECLVSEAHAKRGYTGICSLAEQRQQVWDPGFGLDH